MDHLRGIGVNMRDSEIEIHAYLPGGKQISDVLLAKGKVDETFVPLLAKFFVAASWVRSYMLQILGKELDQVEVQMDFAKGRDFTFFGPVCASVHDCVNFTII